MQPDLIFETTYLGAALTAVFIVLLLMYFIGEKHARTSGGRLTYLLFGFVLGYPVFYLALLFLPLLLGRGG